MREQIKKERKKERRREGRKEGRQTKRKQRKKDRKKERKKETQRQRRRPAIHTLRSATFWLTFPHVPRPRFPVPDNWAAMSPFLPSSTFLHVSTRSSTLLACVLPRSNTFRWGIACHNWMKGVDSKRSTCEYVPPCAPSRKRDFKMREALEGT